jgi:hypothetical protein
MNKDKAIPLASTMRSAAQPRFTVCDGGHVIDDDDFLYDALISIGGDFGDDAIRTAFAQWVADALNAADASLPRVSREELNAAYKRLLSR